jgi:hypothetical protein
MKNNQYMHSDIAPEQSEMNALMFAIVEKSADDLRLAFRRDISNRKFSSSANAEYNTKNLISFFGSPWGHLCCGKIDPWYIVSKLLDEEIEQTSNKRVDILDWCENQYRDQVKDFYEEIKERS